MSWRNRLQRAGLWALALSCYYFALRALWDSIEAFGMLFRYSDAVVEDHVLRATTDATLLLLVGGVFCAVLAVALYQLGEKVSALAKRMKPVYSCPGCFEEAHAERDGCDYAKLTWRERFMLRVSRKRRREAEENSA